MTDFVGRDGSLAVFSNATDAVIIDTSLNLVVGLGKADVVLSSRDWQSTNETFSNSTIELASGALTTLDIKVITASAGRMYTIPAGVVSEAKKGLNWRKEEKRGGTPVGLNSARTLAKGGQIGIQKIRHIAKYFPRHEVDKKGKGWEPGEDNFPSNGRIAWALWGGDAAWRWASAIVERENKKATTAGGYTTHGYEMPSETYNTPYDYDTDVDAFKDAFDMNEGVVPEFMARVRLDGSGMDRLYKLDTDGQVYVWDDMGWDSIGSIDGDVWTYDKALDDPYDTCEKDHVIIDPESAMIMSALLQETPFGIVSINDIAPEEAEMFEYAAPEEDWDFLRSITAAMPPQAKAPSGSVAEDGTYSPKERSINAKSQTRDASGMFVAKGSRVVVGNDGENGRGVVTGFNPTTGGTKVQLDNGKTIDVPAKMTQKEDKFKQPEVAPAATAPSAEELAEPLDVSGILGEPRSPINQPTAQIPGTQSPMDQRALQDVLQNWGGFVEAQRAAFKPITDQQAKDYAKKTGQKVAPTPATLDPNTTSNAGAASKQIAVPGENGQISVKQAPMMAGRASLPKGPQASDLRNAPGTAVPRPVAADPRNSPGANKSTPASKPKGPMREYRASKGDSLYSIAQKTVPKGKDVGSWFNAIKEMNKGKKLYSNSGVALPPGSSQYKQGMPYPSSSIKPPAPKKADPRNAPGTNVPRPKPADPRNAPGSNASPKQADPRNSPGANKSTKPAAKPTAKPSPKSDYDDKGRYIVQKGDSLWSIAQKTKPADKTTAQHWADIMKANKGNIKSGNPSLIYSGERMNIPGRKVKPADPRNAPGSNAPAKKADPRNAPGTNVPRPKQADSRNSPGANASPKKADPRNAPGTNVPRPKSSAPKYKPVGENKIAGDAKKAVEKVLNPSPKSSAPAPKSAPSKYKPVGNNKVAENAKKGLDLILKPKGSAGARKRKSN